MKSLEYDTSKSGLEAVLKDWQIKAMQALWESHEGETSRVVWERVNKMLGDESISRASIINFLDDMRNMKVLSAVDQTGKGGHHGVYSPAMDETELKRFLAETLVKCLFASFPDETLTVIQKME